MAPFKYVSSPGLSFCTEKRAGSESIYYFLRRFFGGLTDHSASPKFHLGCLSRAPFHEFEHFDLSSLVVMILYDRGL